MANRVLSPYDMSSLYKRLTYTVSILLHTYIFIDRESIHKFPLSAGLQVPAVKKSERKWQFISGMGK